MEAVTMLYTLYEKINKETEHYGRLRQRSFQLSLDISYETSNEVRTKKQVENTTLETQLTEVDKALTRFQEQLKKYKELITALLQSAYHTSTFNTSPPSTQQLFPITPASSTLSPRTQPSTPITGSENSVLTGPATSRSAGESSTTHSSHITSHMESTSNSSSPFFTPTPKKVPYLPSRLPIFNLDNLKTLFFTPKSLNISSMHTTTQLSIEHKL